MNGAAPETAASTDTRVPPAAGSGMGVAEPPGLFSLIRSLLAELPGLVSDRVQLLSLELKRASRALAQMVALVVAAAVLSVTAWFALWAGLAAAAIQSGVPWGWVAFGILLVNLVAAVLAVRHALKLSKLLTLPATVRQLTHGARASAADEGERGVAPDAAGSGAPRPSAAA